MRRHGMDHMRYGARRALACALVCLSAFALLLPCPASADDMLESESVFMADTRYSRLISVPERGDVYYYAQNDPLWGNLIYEQANSSTKRPFRDSGCSPSAAAMALRVILPEEALPAICGYAKRPYALCTCSLNTAACIWKHVRFQLNAQKDIVKYLPLILGDFATGNNVFGVKGRGANAGTSSGYLNSMETIYGIRVTTTTDFSTAREAVNNGCGVVVHVGAGGVFTNTGHYVLLASVTDSTVYFLDPLQRDTYTMDKRKKLTVVEPGLVALSMKDLSSANIGGYMIFSNEESPSGTAN